MKLIFCIAALLAGVAVQPAHAQLSWYEGEATLSTGITIRGELRFQPEANTLILRTAGKWRTYPASQLDSFQYFTIETARFHHFTVYSVALDEQEEAIALIFEELVPSVTVRLLQLPGSHTKQKSRYGLPRVRTAHWQTPQPWYVWLDERFVAPDAFVETELPILMANAPVSVQQWATRFPRPGNPKALSRWLSSYHREMSSAQGNTGPKQTTERFRSNETENGQDKSSDTTVGKVASAKRRQ